MCSNSLFRGSIGLWLQVAFATKRPLRRRAYAEATISGLEKLSRRFSKGEGELSKGVVERRTSNESALKIGQNHKLLFVSRSSGRRLQLPELCKISRRQDLRCFFQFPLLSALSTKEATKVLTLPISIIRSLGSCNNILPALLSLPVNYFQEKQQGFFLIILHGFFQG